MPSKKELMEIYSGKSRRKAVFLFCHECNGYSQHREKGNFAPSYQETGHEVTKCTNKKCPLYPYKGVKKEPVEIDWL